MNKELEIQGIIQEFENCLAELKAKQQALITDFQKIQDAKRIELLKEKIEDNNESKS